MPNNLENEYKDYVEYQNYQKLQQDSAKAHQEVSPKPFQPADNQDKATNFQDKLNSPGQQEDVGMLKNLIGMGASHIAGVANPLMSLLAPKGMAPSDLQQAMDPKGDHSDAYASGEAQGVATPIMAGAAVGGPAAIAAGGQFAAEHPYITKAVGAAGVAGLQGTILGRLLHRF